ncbi:hypothetical protein [Parvibaculum sp.]|uniref:hypothetical protein n=1 Tax=Parvibaculum sp. TaxID=2024848 RepID=UPI003BAA3F21
MFHAALAVAAPLILVAEPEVRTEYGISRITISKADAVHEWPFSVDTGELACMRFTGRVFVFFTEGPSPENTDDLQGYVGRRMVIVTANPFELFSSMDNRDLYAPFDSLETLIKRLGPYEAMGRKPCAAAQNEN